MVTYARDEIVSASEAARNFSSILKELSSDENKRFVISKNNKLEAVLLPIKEYEFLKNTYEIYKKRFKGKN